METIQFFSIQYVILEGIVLESFDDQGKFEPKQNKALLGFPRKMICKQNFLKLIQRERDCQNKHFWEVIKVYDNCNCGEISIIFIYFMTSLVGETCKKKKILMFRTWLIFRNKVRK